MQTTKNASGYLTNEVNILGLGKADNDSLFYLLFMLWCDLFTHKNQVV
jgi:hypothetical protein